MTHPRALRAVLLLCCLVLVGNASRCQDDDPPTLVCDSLSLRVDPGGCVEFENPCGDHQWGRHDSFRACDPPNGLYVSKEQVRLLEPSFFVCAAEHAEPGAFIPVDYFYVSGEDFGEGQMRVSVGSGLSVVATANPHVVPDGGSAQLNAQTTAGDPPFRFIWTPANGLSQTDIENPVATPSTTTNYTVTVTDGSGSFASDTVRVYVGVGLDVTATPETIAPGESAQLAANPVGGTPPYQFSWNPAIYIDDAASGAPTVTPPATRTYTVTVTDASGAQATGSVSVEVELEAAASAVPDAIAPGESAQLEAIAAGGTPPYSFLWTPADTLDDAHVASPVATPPGTTAYTVQVTDATGRRAEASATVDVVGGALGACFTATRLGPSSVQVDASCSTGEIDRYGWWPAFVSNIFPPAFIDTFACCRTFDYPPGESGPRDITIRLVVLDAANNFDETEIVIPDVP
jgi:hypothetical protein